MMCLSLSLILINWLCFRILCALISASMDQKAQDLWMENYSNRLAEMTKELGYRGNKKRLE